MNAFEQYGNVYGETNAQALVAYANYVFLINYGLLDDGEATLHKQKFDAMLATFDENSLSTELINILYGFCIKEYEAFNAIGAEEVLS